MYDYATTGAVFREGSDYPIAHLIWKSTFHQWSMENLHPLPVICMYFYGQTRVETSNSKTFMHTDSLIEQSQVMLVTALLERINFDSLYQNTWTSKTVCQFGWSRFEVCICKYSYWFCRRVCLINVKLPSYSSFWCNSRQNTKNSPTRHTLKVKAKVGNYSTKFLLAGNKVANYICMWKSVCN